jgi:hypothetical protein
MNIGLAIREEIINGKHTRPGQAGVMSKQLFTLSDIIF